MEYKFRGKNLNTGEWEFGHYLTKKLCDGKDRHHYIKSDGNDGAEVIEKTVGQFTRRPDKNGVEIYEGDIVTFGNSKTRYVVKWMHDGWICISNDGDDWGPYTHRLFVNTGDFKKNGQPIVQGNIHYNPELMKS